MYKVSLPKRPVDYGDFMKHSFSFLLKASPVTEINGRIIDIYAMIKKHNKVTLSKVVLLHGLNVVRPLWIFENGMQKSITF